MKSILTKKQNRVVTVFFGILAIIVFLPVLLVIMSAFSSEASVTAYGYRFIPHEFSLESFRYMIRSGSTLPRSFFNSLIITLTGTVLSLLVMTPCAYALSRKEFKHRGILMIYIMIPMIFSGGLVSSYMVNTQILHLKNTYFAMILPTLCSTWYLMLMYNYFRASLPDSVVESAKMDGATPVQTLIFIVTPVCRPVIMTVAIFQMFGYWNSWYPSLLYIDTNHTELYPLQYVLVNIERTIQAMILDARYLSGMNSYTPPSVTMRMAMVVVAVVPIMILFPFFRKFLETGLTVGSVKG